MTIQVYGVVRDLSGGLAEGSAVMEVWMLEPLCLFVLARPPVDAYTTG
jgi:hypothetical protein